MKDGIGEGMIEGDADGNAEGGGVGRPTINVGAGDGMKVG